jgi:hypothetical protein
MTTMNPETRKTFTDRSNARKGALRLIAAGTAPSSQFDIVKHGDREFEIVFVPMKADVEITRGPTRVARGAKSTAAIARASKRAQAYVDPTETLAATPPAQRARASRKPRTADGPRPARPTGKRAAIAEAAAKGTLPQPPDFSANTHKPYRARLAKLVELVAAGDLAGLRAVEMVPPRSSSPKALHKYRDLAIIALEARAASRSPSTEQIEGEIAAASESTPA